MEFAGNRKGGIFLKEKQKIDLIETAIKKEGQPVMYIGPSFLGIVQSNTTFTNGYPPKFKELLKKHKFLNGLLIPVDSLAEAMKKLRTKDSALNLLYKEAQMIGGK